jgi:hypothetical protein
MQVNLYVTTGTGSPRYWYIGEAACSFCGADIQKIAFHVRVWKKSSGFEDLIICTRCTSKVPQESVFAPVQERRAIIIADSIPLTSRPVIPRRPDLSVGSINLYEAASQKNAPSERIKDLTVCSGRDDFTVRDDSAPVLVGADVQHLLDVSDKNLSLKDGLSLLDSLQEMKPTLSQDEKILLEDKGTEVTR